MKAVRLIFTCILFFFLGTDLPGQLTFIVDAIPSNTPDSASVYLAGSFNGWQPGLPDYRLEKDSVNRYIITFNPGAGVLEFKFTRGSWAMVEGGANGGFRPNRTYTYPGSPDTAFFQVLSWEDLGGTNSTASENVHILDEGFYLPALDRFRRLWIYLPPDYDSSGKRYKVLYMHDGQNLFDAATSFAGEWEIDETLNTLFNEGDAGCIVVGIDNGGNRRLDEYSPWQNPDYGGGEGDDYLQDIIGAVKPFVDANYRTMPGRDHTGIMGSSMGGLISMYGGLQYDSVFSRIGIFSCSYWFARDAAFAFAENDTHERPMRIYAIAGANEGGNIPADALAMDSLLRVNGYADNEISTRVHPDGQHGEWYWAREFEGAYQWMWAPLTSAKKLHDEPEVLLYPNPAADTLHVRYNGNDPIRCIRVFDLTGKLYLQVNGASGSLSVGSLPGQYVVQVRFASGRILSRTMVRRQ